MKLKLYLPTKCVLISAVFLTTVAGAADRTADNLSGKWELAWVQFGVTNIDRIALTNDSGKITGKAFWGLIIEGSSSDDKLELRFTTKDRKKDVATLTGKIQEDRITGVMKLDDKESNWSARRPAVRPADAARIHEFAPAKFHNHFSGAIAPVQRIWPGDTVRTETVDAGGVDKNGVARSRGGNPLTGPFYVEGALRGDTLVIHFNKIRLNRDTAHSGTAIASNALEPWYKPKEVKDFDSTWRLDREKGTARLEHPTEKLKGFTVPLQPFLGCVGVAPFREQTLHSGDLGPFGGNLDYNQVREGTTLSLPVFQAGALLFVGDGHAAQGDGELTGDALETSMDVEFTVDVIPEKSHDPRLESDEYIMALGIANSLPEALQRATTQMALWLEQDYKLNASEVAMVMGFAVKYDVAELVDPHVNVVAKIKKSALAKLMKE